MSATDPVIIIPIKPFREAKSRLSEVLSAEQRERLGSRMARQVLEVAARAVGAPRLIVVSRCRNVLLQSEAIGARALHEGIPDHNAAVEQAMRLVASERASPVLILSSDLPRLHVSDIEAMLDDRPAQIRIATDIAGQGTNALYLSRPGAIPMCFGPGSRYRHEDAAREAGLSFTTLTRRGLACDVDLPADLAEIGAGIDGMAACLPW